MAKEKKRGRRPFDISPELLEIIFAKEKVGIPIKRMARDFGFNYRTLLKFFKKKKAERTFLKIETTEKKND